MQTLPDKIQHLFQEAYFKSVPAPIRSFIRGKNRAVVFKNAMDLFLKDPAACAFPGHPVLIDLIYGWGNEAWSARDEYLAACINCALTTPGPILECGSGLTSIVVSAVAKKRSISHWILEHQPNWSEKLQGYLNDYGLDSIIMTKPLKDYGDFSWYDVSLERLPTEFCLVLCDGPPRRTKGGRYGLVPTLKQKIKPGCLILLDDGGRKDEIEIAERWQRELPSSFKIEGLHKPYVRMKLT